MYSAPQFSLNRFQKTLGRTPDAKADVTGGPGHADLHGEIFFYQMARGVLLVAQVSGLPRSTEPCVPNIFGFHIHEGSSCTGNAEDPFADTGMHYNPTDCPHPSHAGDLPPLFGNQGYAFLSFFTDRFSLEEVMGRTVVIHSSPDDFTSQPSGNSGTKIACGRILPAGRSERAGRI